MRGAIESGKTSVRAIATMVSSISGQAQSRHLSASTFATIANATAPAAAPESWRRR